MMRIYELQSAGGIDSLKLLERPTPRPGPGEVLLRIRAANLTIVTCSRSKAVTVHGRNCL
jgi:NADPH:quinone reductase-like Zn-dependent oxidoreductase